MFRYRTACVALAAALGTLQGCSSTNTCSQPGIGHGQILQRLGLGRRNNGCECATVGAGPMIYDGASGPVCDGPFLDAPNFPTGPAGPFPPQAQPFAPPQAQPTPAPPNGGGFTSKARVVDPNK